LPKSEHGLDRWFESEVGYCTPRAAYEELGCLEFAWQDWIPVGHPTMIAGEMGIGKSYFTAELIACFTGCRETWPNQEPIDMEPARVLVVDTEQMKGIYFERLDRMGVPDNKWFFGPGTDPLAIPDIVAQHKEIEALARAGRVNAVFIDSLSGGHGAQENDSWMRKVLQPLSTLAASLAVPVIINHHPRKRNKHESSQITLDRIRGSSTIPQFCRSVIGLYHPNDSDNGLVKVESIKHNFTATPEPFGFGFLKDDKGLFFTTEPKERDDSAITEAIEFLRNELSAGKVRSTQLIEDREQAGISEATLNRAKRKIGAKSEREGNNWYWYLPEERCEYERL
jgi:hypothetical protein